MNYKLPAILMIVVLILAAFAGVAVAMTNNTATTTADEVSFNESGLHKLDNTMDNEVITINVNAKDVTIDGDNIVADRIVIKGNGNDITLRNFNAEEMSVSETEKITFTNVNVVSVNLDNSDNVVFKTTESKVDVFNPNNANIALEGDTECIGLFSAVSYNERLENLNDDNEEAFLTEIWGTEERNVNKSMAVFALKDRTVDVKTDRAKVLLKSPCDLALSGSMCTVKVSGDETKDATITINNEAEINIEEGASIDNITVNAPCEIAGEGDVAKLDNNCSESDAVKLNETLSVKEKAGKNVVMVKAQYQTQIPVTKKAEKYPVKEMITEEYAIQQIALLKENLSKNMAEIDENYGLKKDAIIAEWNAFQKSTVDDINALTAQKYKLIDEITKLDKDIAYAQDNGDSATVELLQVQLKEKTEASKELEAQISALDKAMSDKEKDFSDALDALQLASDNNKKATEAKYNAEIAKYFELIDQKAYQEKQLKANLANILAQIDKKFSATQAEIDEKYKANAIIIAAEQKKLDAEIASVQKDLEDLKAQIDAANAAGKDTSDLQKQFDVKNSMLSDFTKTSNNLKQDAQQIENNYAKDTATLKNAVDEEKKKITSDYEAQIAALYGINNNDNADSDVDASDCVQQAMPAVAAPAAVAEPDNDADDCCDADLSDFVQQIPAATTAAFAGAEEDSDYGSDYNATDNVKDKNNCMTAILKEAGVAVAVPPALNDVDQYLGMQMLQQPVEEE